MDGYQTSTTVTQVNQDTVTAGSWDTETLGSRNAPNDEKCTCLSAERLSARMF